MTSKQTNMVKIGKRNSLPIVRKVDFGMYLDGGDGMEILLPSRYVTETMKPGDVVDVFIYTDSEDRPVATTETPLATVGEVAFLEVVAVNRIGAFLDWGLMKDLLVPFREQKSAMKVGGVYPVYIYLDDASGRVVATAKIEKYLGNVIPRYKNGDKVKALIWRKSPIGMTCVVDNLHQGMIYDNETFVVLEPGQEVDAWVKRVRPDGKIDLYITEPRSGRQRTERLADEIVERMEMSDGQLGLTDKSSPEEIRKAFQCSKRDFKQAIGHLLKDGIIMQSEGGLSLLKR